VRVSLSLRIWWIASETVKEFKIPEMMSLLYVIHYIYQRSTLYHAGGIIILSQFLARIRHFKLIIMHAFIR
jgi:hypothetical protein